MMAKCPQDILSLKLLSCANEAKVDRGFLLVRYFSVFFSDQEIKR